MTLHLLNSKLNYVACITPFSRIIAYAIFYFQFSASAFASNYTITMTQPSIVSACRINSFHIQYSNTDSVAHTINIHAALSNHQNNCASTSMRQMVFQVDSFSTNVTSIGYDSVSNNYSFHISDTNAIVSIWYKLYIDCTVHDLTTDSSQNITLAQSFTDTTSQVLFAVAGGSGNSILINNVSAPSLLPPVAIPEQFFNYLQSSFITIPYINNTLTSSDIKFNFRLSDASFCGAGKVISYKYKSGSSGTATAFTPATFTNVKIDSAETLYIILEVADTACYESCIDTAIMKWHCSDSTFLNTFCTSCLAELKTPFTITENDAPQLKIV